MHEWETGGSSKHKYLMARRTLYGNLNDHEWQWFCTARSKNIPMTGRLIQVRATMLAVAMGHADFTAYNGWLESFKKRHDINFKASVLSGEAADVMRMLLRAGHSASIRSVLAMSRRTYSMRMRPAFSFGRFQTDHSSSKETVAKVESVRKIASLH